MRKLKQICSEYKQYANFHNDKIFTMALKSQINQNPSGTQLKFCKKAAKSYFRDKYPKVYAEMTEKDWGDVSKRLSSIFQKEKNVNPALYKFRQYAPNLFEQSKQVSQASVNFGEEFELYDETPLPVEESGVPDQKELNFKAVSDKLPKNLDATFFMDRYFDKSSSVRMTLPDSTMIQFNK
ncbi:MAG: hypothetical protein CMO44_15175 [Verrucomicrobiales bacterium]|nr:hypothetical protein [Verrucomicrobiales bacterium]